MYTEWPKSKLLPNYQTCKIVLKSANEIRFLRQIKEMTKPLNNFCVIFLTSITMPDPQTSDMHHT